MAPTRPLPHSLDAERGCLGAVLIRPSALDELAALTSDDFMLPAHREIFEAMRRLAARGRAVDILMLTDELKAAGMLARLDGGAVYLNDLANATPTAENVRHYAATVGSMAALRRTIAICRDVATSAYGDVQDVPGFLAEARAKMAAVEVAGDEGAVRIGDRVVAVMDEMEKRGDNPEKHVITTGISSLDDIIVGLFPKTVSIIAANPSRGKTALALNTIIRVALRGIPCLFFSLEMSTNQIIERALTYASRVNGRSVQAGRMSGPEWLRVQRAANEWIRTSLPAWVDDRVLTADKLCAYARRWRARVRAERLAAGMDKNEAELALVAIDYLGLVRGDDDSESRRLEVAAMSRKFKQLAKDESIAVLECAQLSRANMKDAKEPRAPILSDLRDAGEIEQDGDVIMFPWWTGTPAMVGPHEGVILVRKNRNGPTGDAKVYWEREYMTFSGRGDEEDDQPVLVR